MKVATNELGFGFAAENTEDSEKQPIPDMGQAPKGQAETLLFPGDSKIFSPPIHSAGFLSNQHVRVFYPYEGHEKKAASGCSQPLYLKLPLR
jgi:hypothetical protein